MLNRAILAFAVLNGLLWQSSAWSGKYNETLNIGDPAPSWKQLPGVDGQPHSLSDLADKEVVVLVFTCNDCPVAVAYEERIKAFTKKYIDRSVAVVALCVNRNADNELSEMKARAEQQGFNFLYLRDDSQKIGHAYGATVTPEFFVLDKKRKVVYMGSMDDKVKQPKVNYLEPAVEAALRGEKPAMVETVGFGCAIKYAKRPK
jgi:peroxiredoxin